jgi:branched-subunit amino acid transport protein AzlD
MLHSAALVAAMAIVTILLRFLPFWVFGGKKQTPPVIAYLGKVLPFAIMGMLVVYCLKSVDFTQSPYALPEMISCAVVVVLHLWKRNTILSIAGGTACYMLLVQVIFA